jgi:Domain of unknown function (DUF4351)
MTRSIVGDKFRAEGEAKGSLKLILRQGTKKFGCEPSQEELTTLNAITDIVKLEHLADRLLDVNSWTDLLAGI